MQSTARVTGRRVLALCLFALPLAAVGAELRAPSNPQASSAAPAPGEPYRVWVAGRAQGRGAFPVASLLASRGRVDSSGVRALFLIDDGLRTPAGRRALTQFGVPLFRVPGASSGPRSYALRIGSDLWISADLAGAGVGADAGRSGRAGRSTGAGRGGRTSRTGSALPPELLAQLRAAAADPTVRAVVVLALPMVWAAADDPQFAALRRHGGAAADPRATARFAGEIRPLLDELAATRPVVWISGDRRGFPPFHWRDPDSERNLRFVATGLAGDENDALIEVSSDGAGRLDLGLVSLADRDLARLEAYDAEYWRIYHESRFAALRIDTPTNLRWWALALFVTSARFLTGAALGALAVIALALGIRRVRRPTPGQ